MRHVPNQACLLRRSITVLSTSGDTFNFQSKLLASLLFFLPSALPLIQYMSQKLIIIMIMATLLFVLMWKDQEEELLISEWPERSSFLFLCLCRTPRLNCFRYSQRQEGQLLLENQSKKLTKNKPTLSLEMPTLSLEIALNFFFPPHMNLQ